MHVVLYHDAVIPPPKYGGTERVIYHLARALTALSHRVTLIARAGSQAGNDVELICLSERERANWKHYIPKSADILHLQGTPQETLPRPFLVTIHGNGQPDEKFHPNTVFVSERHALNHGSRHFVHNGIDPDDYTCSPVRGNQLVFLAKASWSVKNLKGAIQVARRAGLPLEVMGSRDWPFGLRRPSRGGIHYHGMVGDKDKRVILGKAKGLLFPVRWHEPFGLAAIEALASGCPVFATPYGALPEIVTAECGLLSIKASDHVQALLEREFSPERCRERVIQNFTHFHMARKYILFYERVLAEGTLGPSPKTPSTRAALLDWVP